MGLPQGISRGTPRLNELVVNVDKDWLGYLIKNLGAPVDSGDAFRLGDEITDAMHGSRGAITDAHSHDDLASVTTDQHHAQDHEARHEAGGADEIPSGALNPQDPTAHASSHADGGADELDASASLEPRAVPGSFEDAALRVRGRCCRWGAAQDN